MTISGGTPVDDDRDGWVGWFAAAVFLGLILLATGAALMSILAK